MRPIILCAFAFLAATAWAQEDEPYYRVTLSPEKVRVCEGSAVTFTVTVDPPVEWDPELRRMSAHGESQTARGTADSAGGGDFRAFSEPVYFARGDTTSTFTVKTFKDAVEDDNETFGITVDGYNIIGENRAELYQKHAQVTIIETGTDDAGTDCSSIAPLTGGTPPARLRRSVGWDCGRLGHTR